MTFKACTEKSSMLQSIFEAMSFLVDDIVIKIDENGIRSSAMDTSHVGMIMARLPPSTFLEFNAPGTPARIEININDMVKILRRAKSSDSIELSQSDDTSSIMIRMKSPKSTRTFKIKCKEPAIDTSDDNLMENFEQSLRNKFTLGFKIVTTLLDEFIKDSSIVSDLMRVDFNSDNKVLSFAAEGNSGDVEIELDISGESEDDGVWNSSITGNASGSYSIGFLENFIKLQKVIDHVDISIGENIPVRLAGELNGNGSVVYLLAPRVEENDDDDFNVSSDGVDDLSGDGDEEPSEDGDGDA